MYGYLRLISKNTPSSIYKHYRGLYCSLCHALWKFYGLKSRFLLSYDMTFLAVVLDLDNHISFGKKLVCYKKADIDSQDENWRRIAAMSVLLAAKKLEDDIADENDLKAKIGLRVFKKAAKKAEEDYPEVARVFQEGLAEMTVMEKEKADVFALAKKFGDITSAALSLIYACPSEDVTVMRHVSEWVYFIDALDDLEDDVKDGAYNPLKAYASTRRMLIDKEYDLLETFIATQMDKLKPVLSAYTEGSERNYIILSILTNTLPIVTSRVLKGELPFAKRSPLTRALEVKGGYRLA